MTNVDKEIMVFLSKLLTNEVVYIVFIIPFFISISVKLILGF